MATLHYASENVRNGKLDPAAAAAGFNLADVNDPQTLKSLPDNVKGLYWLDEAKGVTPSFIAQMNAIKGDPHLFAVYLADEPYPDEVKASDLKAESDWIHKNMPGVKTFIVACNMGSERNPSFENYFTVENTHIDLWGLDPYPIRSEMSTPDYAEIDRQIIAAQKQIGVKAENIVPVFQAFGGVDDGDNGEWVMPTPEQARMIMDRFAKYVPNPAFDFAYSWGQQDGNISLSTSPTLQAVFKEHNTGTYTDGTLGDIYTGTAGNDRHAGTSQDDTISGRSGNDVLGGKSGDDAISGGLGNDRMSGSAGADHLAGGWGADSLRGGLGNDVVAGGYGKDYLFGDSGNDTFLFNTKPSLNNRDLVVGFSQDHDTIALDHDVFKGLGAGPLLEASAFKDIASQAQDGNDRILYDHESGRLSYDADGKGGQAPVQIAILDNHPTLTHADFAIM